MSSPKRVFLADDHAVLRDGLRAILEAQADILVVGDAADGRTTVREVACLAPDVVIMDIFMPELNGIEATRQIVVRSDSVHVLILSMDANTEHIRRALQAGADGYLLKESAGREVVDAVRAVARGERYLSPKVSNLIMDVYVRGFGTHEDPDRLERLSPREREVLRLVVKGLSSREIAAVLNVTPSTIDTYRSRIKQKLGTESLAELIQFVLARKSIPE